MTSFPIPPYASYSGSSLKSMIARRHRQLMQNNRPLWVAMADLNKPKTTKSEDTKSAKSNKSVKAKPSKAKKPAKK